MNKQPSNYIAHLEPVRWTPNSCHLITLQLARIPLFALLAIGLAFVQRSLGLWIWLLVAPIGTAIRARFAKADELHEVE